MTTPPRNPFTKRTAMTVAAVAAAVSLAAAGVSAATATAPSTSPGHVTAAHTTDARGTVLWKEHLRGLSPAQTRALLTNAEFSPGQVRFGVDLYRLLYDTVDPAGRSTTASGLLVVPRTKQRDLRTVSFAHGTESFRGDAPSSAIDDFAAAPAIAYGAAGYAAVAPDYLGLGIGPGPHPWFDVPSETTASLDLLRAARNAMGSTSHRMSGDVMATGFSQGASAALGLARSLQGGADPSLRLRAVAPVSGAYAFESAELPAAKSGQVVGPIAVPYVAYLLVSYNRLHHLYTDPAAVFRQPYANRVETLFGSNVPGQDMIAALPQSLDQLLTPAGTRLLYGPRLATALRTNDTICAYHPTVPTQLLFATDDEQAVNANTTACAESFAQHGAAVPTVNLGTPDYEGSRHLGSSVAAVPATLAWFDRLGLAGATQ